MSKISNFITGKKTYFVAGLMIAYAVIGYAVLGKPFDTDLFLQALALAGLRNAIK